MTRTFARTGAGYDIDLTSPDLSLIRIEDIAHHLALINRYNGAPPYPYSVAQHSLLVAKILPDYLKLYGLLHDAAEYLLGDLVSPAKRIPELGAVYRPLENRVQRTVYLWAGLDPDRDLSEVKKADKAVEAVEMIVLLEWPDIVDIDNLPPVASVEIKPMAWEDVKRDFMMKFISYTMKLKRGLHAGS